MTHQLAPLGQTVLSFWALSFFFLISPSYFVIHLKIKAPENIDKLSKTSRLEAKVLDFMHIFININLRGKLFSEINTTKF